MNINFSNRYCCLFYQFDLAVKHFRIATVSGDKNSITQLVKDKVITQTKNPSPPSLCERISHLLWAGAEIIPIVGLIAAIANYVIFNVKPDAAPSLLKRVQADDSIETVIKLTQEFAGYKVGSTDKKLTSFSLRPANLFFSALLGIEKPTTMPGESLFAFKKSQKDVRDHIMALDDNQVITVSAKAKQELKAFGDEEYKISAKEIKDSINSQKALLSPLLPMPFYLGFKQAMNQDGWITLPGSEGTFLVTMQSLINDNSEHKAVCRFLKAVQTNPAEYGFSSVNGKTPLSFDELMSLTLYQVGAMVVKTDSFHLFVGEGYQIRQRQPHAKDEILLISSSGIRGFSKPATLDVRGNQKHAVDRNIMKYTFKTALQSIENGGYAVFPAVGMGVWAGDPDIYWRAFLDAVLEDGGHLEHLFVNPAHQQTRSGNYNGCTGNEFQTIFNEYIKQNPNHANLKKIINLFDQKTDLLLLAQNLKLSAPEKTVAIFNASDPDVTFGNHVGEYVNNLNHPATTEENFAAAGSSGLGFEGITELQKNEGGNRIIQAK